MNQLPRADDANYQEKEKRLLQAMSCLDNNPDGVFWIETFGKIVYVNDASCATLGYSKEELLNMTIQDIAPEMVGVQMGPDSEMWKSVKNGYLNHFQSFHKHRDGHLIPVDIVSTVLETETDLLVSCTVHNISERIKSEERLLETYSRLSVLYEVYRKTSRKLDIEALITEVFEILQKSLKFDALLIYLLDDSPRGNLLFRQSGLPEEVMHHIKNSDGFLQEALSNNTLKHGKIHEMFDYSTIGTLSGSGFTDAAVSPIVTDDAMAAGIFYINKYGREIDENDQELLIAVSSQISTLIKNIKLINSLNKELEERKRTEEKLKRANKELERIASTDQLTGTWNRRHFSQAVEIETERARRYNDTMSLLIIDIDTFKRINDEYGHQQGDLVLVELAKLLRANLRVVDSLTRWGGEEFIILAPKLNSAEALKLAERLRQLVASHTFARVGRVTISIGVAEFNKSIHLNSWIRNADQALYRAKELGRNRVELGV